MPRKLMPHVRVCFISGQWVELPFDDFEPVMYKYNREQTFEHKDIDGHKCLIVSAHVETIIRLDQSWVDQHADCDDEPWRNR